MSRTDEEAVPRDSRRVEEEEMEKDSRYDLDEEPEEQDEDEGDHGGEDDDDMMESTSGNEMMMKMMGLMMGKMFEKMERERKLERDRNSRREKEAERARRQRELEDRAYKMEQDKIMHQLRQEELRLKERELKMMMEKEERISQVTSEKEARKEKIERVKLPAPMTNKTDLTEFLRIFEEVADIKEIPEAERAIVLKPLLNDKYWGIATKLPPEVQSNYGELKEALRSRDEANVKNTAATFWHYVKKPGTTALEENQTLLRLATRFITGADAQTCADQLTKEWTIQRLPKEARQYVRERKPTKSSEAVELIEEYYANKEQSYSTQRGMTISFDPPKEETTNRYHPYRKDYGKGYKESWRQQSPSRESGKREVIDLTKESQHEEKTKSKNPQEKRPSKQFECYNCGKVGHMARDCRSQRPQRVNHVQEVSLCQLCDGKGHSAKECALRVNRIEMEHKKQGKPPAIREGKVHGKVRKDILLDSGAQVSVIAEESLPRDYKKNGMIRIKTINSPTTQHPATLVDVEIADQKFTIRAVVLKKDDITHDLIVGENLPGMSVHDLMDKTLRAIPKPVEAPKEEELPAQVNQLQMVNVVTRAQAKRAEKTEEEDRQATAESQAKITDWDKVEVLPEPETTEEEGDMEATPSIPDDPTDRKQMAKRQKEDETLKDLFEAAKHQDSQYEVFKGLLVKKSSNQFGEKTRLLVVPTELRKEVWRKSHSSPMAGHFGAKKTLKKMTNYFYWKDISKDTNRWCKACEVCQKHNMGTQPRAPLKPLPVIDEPRKRVAIDIVGPLPRTKSGFKYILTGMDFSSRYPEAIPLKRVDTEAVSEAILEMISQYGIPEEILSDNGTVFTSKLMKTLFETLEITGIKTSPYHPQSNGMIERFHRTLKTIISKIEDPTRWATALPIALFAARDTPHAATGFTPFQLLFGHNVNGPAAALHRVWTSKYETPRKVTEYVEGMKRKLAKAVEIANMAEMRAKERSKEQYDRGTKEDVLEEGAEVLLLHPSVDAGWRACWEGPYTVQKQVSPVTHRINTPGRHGAIIHRNSLKRFTRTYNVNHVILADGELDTEGQLRLPGLPGTEVDEGAKMESEMELTDQQKRELEELKLEYKMVISTLPGTNRGILMDIEVKDGKPINVPPYRIPVRWKGKLAKEIQTLLDLEVIEPSTSPWAAPVVCVTKPDGSLRMCVDYRALNQVTVPDPYPMPRIEELIDKVASAQFISTLDLNKGYYQVPLNDKAREKTAFITPQGKFQFRKIPFGLRNAPTVFQRMMDNILMDHPRSTAYIDDVVVASTTWEEHMKDLRDVFERLKKNGITVKEAKCTFARATVSFLGHNLGKGKVSPQEAKLEALEKYTQPKTKKDLQAYLGFIGYYRKFIPEFAANLATLTDATAKSQPEKLQWTDRMDKEFKHLKKTLLTATALNTFNPQLKTELHTDASDRGLGAVLLQNDKEGTEKPVAYFSKKLLPRQQRYTISEKECLALVEAVKHFEAYLLGEEFTIVTDHKALLALPKTTSGGARITRWALALQPYNFKLVHKPGKRHLDADGLSRQAEDESEQKVKTTTQDSTIEPYNPYPERVEGWKGGCWAQAHPRCQNPDQTLWETLVKARMT